MGDFLATGIFIVLAAGAFQGSFLLPTKWMRGWAWENYWLIFAISAYLICPWTVAAFTVPHLLDVYSGISAGAVVVALLCGIGWGLGALAFGLGVDALGLALGFAVILGMTTTTGTLVPLFIDSPKLSFAQGLLTAGALLLMLAGVAVCSFAGRWKEVNSAAAGTRSYGRGVAICIASGLLSACGNIGFALGTEISDRAQSLGAPEHLSANAIWTVLAIPLFLCNAGYAVYLLRKNKTTASYKAPGSPGKFLLCLSMGLMWMAGIMAQEDGSGGPDLDMALDLGCQLGYLHGITSDGFMTSKKINMIGKAIENFRKAGLVAGVCCHAIEVPMLCEKEGIKPSFYIKTHNNGNFWTAGPPLQPDPNWKPTETQLAQSEFGTLGEGHGGGLSERTPRATAAFMQNVKVPWIGFKILGAGALSPREMFPYCFKNGCDAYLVGQFDFQVADNANLTKQLLRDKDKLGRTRSWYES